MQENRKKPLTDSWTKVRPHRCATQRFGIRVTLIPFGYDGTDLLIPLTKKVKQKDWSLIYDVPLLDESLDQVAARVSKEYLPDHQSSIHQIHTFGETNYVRIRWITVVYSAVINIRNGENKSSAVKWFSVERRPLLSRLEDKMIDVALQSLQKRVRYEPVGFYMLPPEFTLQQLQRMYELLLGQSIAKQSFRKKMWESEILIPLEETTTEGGRSQPKGLYRFNKKKYYQLKQKGFFLDL